MQRARKASDRDAICRGETARHTIEWRPLLRGCFLKALGRFANSPVISMRGDFDLLHFRLARRGIAPPSPDCDRRARRAPPRREIRNDLPRPRLSLIPSRCAGSQ